jgi:Mrp family chromosome partitioning ATPase
MFGFSPQGVDAAAVLAGQVPAASAYQRVDLGPNAAEGGMLQVIPSRAAESAPSGLLESPALANLTETLRRDFDLVILDTPPLLSVSDAGIVAGAADAILVVVRAGEVKRAALLDSARLLFSYGVPKLGFVLTGATAQEDYTYRYGYPQTALPQGASNGKPQPLAGAVSADD